MNRRTFTKRACMVCLGPAIASLVASCQATHYAEGLLEPNGLSIPASEFLYTKNNEQRLREFIIVRHEKLEFPIYLFRLSDQSYSALLMKCTHQGAELSASGDHLHCPSHGSEYNNKGLVTQGPAEKNLRSFPVSVNNEKIFIDLRS
ncbi:MAG: ubiquinol-cytochrome c reductase iron-sulfur subunit [Bacteroidota bacterium]